MGGERLAWGKDKEGVLYAYDYDDYCDWKNQNEIDDLYDYADPMKRLDDCV